MPVDGFVPCEVMSRRMESGRSLVTVRVDYETPDGQVIDVDGVQMAIIRPTDAEVFRRSRELYGPGVEQLNIVRANLVGGKSVEELRVRRAINIGGTVLLETDDEPDNWYMGELRSDGSVTAWGGYGDLEAALQAL
jgi:hypothetical protein